MFRLLLWIARTLEQDGEVGRRNAFDDLAQLVHHGRRPDDGPRVLDGLPPADPESGARQLQAQSFDFEHQRADVGRQAECLKIPFAETACWIEAGLEQPAPIGIRRRHLESNRFDLPLGVGSPHPRTRPLAELNRPDRHNAPHGVLEDAAERRNVMTTIETPRQTCHQIRDAPPAIALTLRSHRPALGIRRRRRVRSLDAHHIVRTKRDATAVRLRFPVQFAGFRTSGLHLRSTPG
ncbi:MAG TPA: hypothetical protein VKH42_21150 [Vicinamibacterales bacterium]|nr:hypothetical protein [Vicinamibacterales bacterium]